MGTPRGLQQFKLDLEGLIEGVLSRLKLAWFTIARLATPSKSRRTASNRQTDLRARSKSAATEMAAAA